jgi:hypothetical protein
MRTTLPDLSFLIKIKSCYAQHIPVRVRYL